MEPTLIRAAQISAMVIKNDEGKAVGVLQVRSIVADEAVI